MTGLHDWFQTPPGQYVLAVEGNAPLADGGVYCMEGGRTFEEEMDALSAWRDQHKPGAPIWITETGYDTLPATSITPASVAGATMSERAARIAPPIAITAYEAGAFHSVAIAVSVYN